MTPEIIRKLNEFLVTHDPIEEECEAVYLMVELRKLLDREHGKDPFPKIRFYCDWTVHTSKDRNLAAIQDIMEKLEKSFSNSGTESTKDAFNFFSLSELREEMSDLFNRHGLQANLFQNDKRWAHFVDVLIQVLADQPITAPFKDIASVSFIPGNTGTRTVTIEFTNQRNSITIGVGD